MQGYPLAFPAVGRHSVPLDFKEEVLFVFLLQLSQLPRCLRWCEAEGVRSVGPRISHCERSLQSPHKLFHSLTPEDASGGSQSPAHDEAVVWH